MAGRKVAANLATDLVTNYKLNDMTMSDHATSQARSTSTNRSRVRLRVLAGLIGVALLWQAVQFGLSGSWPLAVFFFLLFGGVEALAFAALAGKPSSRRGDDDAV
jgi:hypothetical protein